MYGIIREGNKQYYITRILGYYGDKNRPKDAFGQYYIVLDCEKKTIIKKYVYNPESKPCLDLSVLLLDDNTDVSEINDNWCWFRARKMSYKILPL